MLPLEFHTGSHSQKDMISSAYSQMTDDIIKVDIYSKLAERTDQYIYFRTDHHWTARGAYFAYVAFCEAKGIDPVASQGDIDVFPEPGAQGDMPSAPEFRNAPGDIGMIEVL